MSVEEAISLANHWTTTFGFGGQNIPEEERELAKQVGGILSNYLPRLRSGRGAAQKVVAMLELGDQRLMASDGPAGGQMPDLSPEEWGKVYRACKVIAALDAVLKEGT